MSLRFPKPKGFGGTERPSSPKSRPEPNNNSFSGSWKDAKVQPHPHVTSDGEGGFFNDDVLRQYKPQLARHGFDSAQVLSSLSTDQMDLMLATCGIDKLGHQLYIRNKFMATPAAAIPSQIPTSSHDAKQVQHAKEARKPTNHPSSPAKNQAGTSRDEEQRLAPTKSSPFQLPPDDSSAASSPSSEPYASPAALADHIIANLLLSSDPVELHDPQRAASRSRQAPQEQKSDLRNQNSLPLQQQNALSFPPFARDVQEIHQSNPYQTLMQLLQDRSATGSALAEEKRLMPSVVSAAEVEQGTAPAHSRRRAARGLSPTLRSIALSPHFPQRTRQ